MQDMFRICKSLRSLSRVSFEREEEEEEEVVKIIIWNNSRMTNMIKTCLNTVIRSYSNCKIYSTYNCLQSKKIKNLKNKIKEYDRLIHDLEKTNEQYQHFVKIVYVGEKARDTMIYIRRKDFASDIPTTERKNRMKTLKKNIKSVVDIENIIKNNNSSKKERKNWENIKKKLIEHNIGIDDLDNILGLIRKQRNLAAHPKKYPIDLNKFNDIS